MKECWLKVTLFHGYCSCFFLIVQMVLNRVKHHRCGTAFKQFHKGQQLPFWYISLLEKCFKKFQSGILKVYEQFSKCIWGKLTKIIRNSPARFLLQMEVLQLKPLAKKEHNQTLHSLLALTKKSFFYLCLFFLEHSHLH